MLKGKRDILIQKIKKHFKNPVLRAKDIGDLSEVGRFADKSWQEVSIEDINVTYSLFFFSPRGFHYFLPAFLLNALSNPEKINPMTIEGLIRDLGAFDNFNHSSTSVKKLFTKQQQKIILEFLTEADYLFIYINPSLKQMTIRGKNYWERRNSELRDLLDAARDYWSN